MPLPSPPLFIKKKSQRCYGATDKHGLLAGVLCAGTVITSLLWLGSIQHAGVLFGATDFCMDPDMCVGVGLGWVPERLSCGLSSYYHAAFLA
jgi:hypothetical protein